jgi:biopolymer transport protein ExbD
MEVNMRHAPPLEPANPLIDVNVTPLIDVMLVLLIMFIITIPIQTHAVKLDLPTACANCIKPDSRVNVITISPTDRIGWNGAAISKAELVLLLRQTQQVQPTPELHLRPDATARYGTVDEVLAIIKREHVRKFGFVGNEAYTNW